ncbi:Tubulin-folding cofactor C [Rhizoctonia solani]|uniref:Tubulin-folding cofactor C n=1 Tax=Rhizoctonia solani TaxID=456999 RepID=A0A0K6GHC5_9AGAM|nr:Tubulin-folding cofactor C [Rhizoctonia solani]
MSDQFDYNGFITAFKAQAQDLEDALSQNKAPDTGTIDQLSASTTKLRGRVNEAVAAGHLPAYDQRLCEERVASLEGSLAKFRANAKSKPKFSFKSSINTKPTTSNSSNNAPTAPGVGLASKQPSTTTPTTKISINNHNHKSLTFADAEGWDSSGSNSAQCVVITIGGLSDCFVDLASGTSPNVNALHIQGLKRTVLYAGKIQGSVLLHDCVECTIIVSTHQFRMHTSNATDVYLEVSSNPVIEKCNNIRFGSYPSKGGTTTAVEPPRSEISGDALPYAVQDFDWMGATPSPNWSVIDSTTFQLPITASSDSLDLILNKLLPDRRP